LPHKDYLEEIMSREAMKQPEALRLADALDAEFVQGRISNSTGRESAVELRRLALKQWVGLTDEEMKALFLNQDDVRFARYIESRLKNKNA
jgi:hydroxymethylglutaryl-CoA reductase